MTDEQRLIEQIVTGVLRQLGTPRKTARANMASEGRKPPGATLESREPGVEGRKTGAAIALDERVITGELLEQRVNGQARIRVAPGSVFTPTARDFVRSRGIEVVRQPTENGATSVDSRWCAVVGEQTDALQRALADVASLAIHACTQKPVELAQVAVSRITNRGATGAVVFTNNPEAVACLANRNVGIRAAVVSDVPSVKWASGRIGANVVAVDPMDKSYFELRNLLKQIVTQDMPQRPPDWPEPD